MSVPPKISLSLLLHNETPGAVLVSLEDDATTVWLPRASIEIAPERSVAPPNRNRKQALARLLVTLPRKLAEAKGLVTAAQLMGQGRLL